MHADVAETTTAIADDAEEEEEEAACQRMHAGSVMEREPGTSVGDADVADDGGFSAAGHGPAFTAAPLLSPLFASDITRSQPVTMKEGMKESQREEKEKGGESLGISFSMQKLRDGEYREYTLQEGKSGQVKRYVFGKKRTRVLPVLHAGIRHHDVRADKVLRRTRIREAAHDLYGRRHLKPRHATRRRVLRAHAIHLE